MPALNRPSLTNTQIKSFKDDVKAISESIKITLSDRLFRGSDELKSLKFKPQTILNSFSKKLGFLQFSEMKLNVTATAQHPEFSIYNVLSNTEISSVYIDYLKYSNYSVLNNFDVNECMHCFVDAVRNVHKNQKIEAYEEEFSVTSKKLFELIIECEYNSDKGYYSPENLPENFIAIPAHKFWNKFEKGSVLKVICSNGEIVNYTITEKEHIYSKKTIFDVYKGVWAESLSSNSFIRIK